MTKVIPKIEDSFQKMDHYPRVIERYYRPFYFLNSKGPPMEHHCVLLHSNKICMITIAPTHPLVKKKKNIIKLDYQVSDTLDRLDNKVRGKSKKGGQHLMPDSVLCYAICDDGTKYPIWACIKGKLLEINQLLLENPNLIIQEPLSKGFIAIILPSLKDLDAYKSKLITHEAYTADISENNK